MYLLTGLGVTIGYHRLFTHKSFETGAIVTTILGVLGSMAVEGSILRWAAFHRRHHRFSDRDGDPHSPHTAHHDGHRSLLGILKGFCVAHVGWMFRVEPSDIPTYVPDLRRSRLIRFLSTTFPVWVAASMLIPAAAGGLLSGSWSGVFLGFLWGGLVRTLLVHHVTWSVNSVCHLWGTRPYKSHDESRNNVFVGVLGFGEGWHNNHHAFPTSARHGLTWWQLDLSYIVIRAMQRAGLVWNVRVPSPERLTAKRAG
jgi:stearoyl-CoA desaturase (delta-9 desaturase)